MRPARQLGDTFTDDYYGPFEVCQVYQWLHVTEFEGTANEQSQRLALMDQTRPKPFLYVRLEFEHTPDRGSGFWCIACRPATAQEIAAEHQRRKEFAEKNAPLLAAYLRSRELNGER